jgi:hypothetical protein
VVDKFRGQVVLAETICPFIPFPFFSHFLAASITIMKPILSLLFGTILLACTANADRLSSNAAASQIATSISLQVREEINPPRGISNSPDRPISFATVLLTFENPDLHIKQITIEQVTIIDHLSQRSLLSLPQPRLITLNPMEHSAIDIQLNQPKPYGAIASVEAIVTYRLGDQIGKSSQIRSKAVSIDRL